MPPRAEPTAQQRQAALMRASVKYAAVKTSGSNPMPQDNPELFRYALMRRVMTLARLPRRCREPVCRRTKVCMGPSIRCRLDFPEPRVSREQEAATMAAVQRAIKRRLAELGMDKA